MIQHPAVLSLLITSGITVIMMLFAGWHGLMIIGRWDLQSGSELQLSLERKTYLITTIIGYLLLFQILSLFLYIFTADDIHPLLTGAMCAAGSLNANRFGYPVLLLKLVTCLAAGVWLIINHVDTRGFDYPLIKPKYAILLALVPLVTAEAVLQFLYFARIRTNVITSCCGSLFSSTGSGIASEMAALPRVPTETAFFVCIAVTTACGIVFLVKGKGGYLFSGASTLTFVVALASLVAFVSLYLYEIPTHHCPFCIIKKEYSHIGYLLYATLAGGGISGLGVGALMPARKHRSLAGVVTSVQKKLAVTAMVLYLIFAGTVTVIITRSALKF